MPRTSPDARIYLDTALLPLGEIYTGPILYREALGIREETSSSFYDCLVLAAAGEARCQILYSEALQSDRRSVP